MDEAHNRGPNEEKAHKRLNSPSGNDNPGASKGCPFGLIGWERDGVRSDGGVKEAGEDAEVGTDVFEDGDSVER